MEPIKGFNGFYEIHAIEQKVWSLKTNKYLKSYTLGPNSYTFTFIQLNGKPKKFRIDQLIGEHFIKKERENDIIIHKNGDVTDNNIQNLVYARSHREYRNRLKNKKLVNISYYSFLKNLIKNFIYSIYKWNK